MEIISGRITKVESDGRITIAAVLPSLDRAKIRGYEEVQIGLPDGRKISPEQRRKAYALIREISDWSGSELWEIKGLMKLEFITKRLQALEKEIFSLADCDVTTAKEFINYLIDFMVEWGVPSAVPLYEQCEDIRRYVYACLMHKKCVICGQGAEMHHVDHVGIGYNRKTKYQIGDRVLPLCREHHMEAHQRGEKEFLRRYYLEPLELTREIGKVYKLTKKALGE